MSSKNNGSSAVAREVLKKFFVLEGIDGAGTTTQLKRIESKSAEAGLRLRADFEPTPHPVGLLIRSILRREVSALPATLAHLFVADRREHLDGITGIRATLGEGSLVLCDRYFFSSLAYQSLDLPWDEVWQMNSSFPLPEALFWFDLPVTAAQARIDLRGQARERFEDGETQTRIRAGYQRALSQAELQGLEIVRLDATQSIEALTDLIWDRICR